MDEGWELSSPGPEGDNWPSAQRLLCLGPEVGFDLRGGMSKSVDRPSGGTVFRS